MLTSTGHVDVFTSDMLPAKALAFSAHRSQIKNMETEIGGDIGYRKVALILSRQRLVGGVRGTWDRVGSCLKICPHLSMKSLGAYIRGGLAVKGLWCVRIFLTPLFLTPSCIVSKTSHRMVSVTQ